ncbi:hypothetical protein EDD16DRAFT_1523914 [Pisolithus croceorrhizus]|nr:hypothetical protein EV401DRAFT_1892917 [Pisolithus croceorrhizus]KAI6106455.1 hypothetical protein EDD16DRAFT_1523914 [Pisolithus croceorrhizus]
MTQGGMLVYHASKGLPQLGLLQFIRTPGMAQLVVNTSAMYSPESTVMLTTADCSESSGTTHTLFNPCIKSFHEEGYPETQTLELMGPILVKHGASWVAYNGISVVLGPASSPGLS